MAEGADIAIVGFPAGHNGVGLLACIASRVLAALTDVAPLGQERQQPDGSGGAAAPAGNFNILQLDVTAFPGNSGGPVFDLESGRVIGVLAMGLIKGTRVGHLGAHRHQLCRARGARVLELLKRGD